MTKVYIANSKVHYMDGLEILKKQGYEIVTVTEGDIDIFHTDRLKYNIEQILDSNPVNRDDYVLLSGSNIINVLLSIEIIKRTGVLNVMLFGAKDKQYHKREKVDTLKI
jgi:regulatory protein YycH of two-component signal transduction system YycFG